MIWSSRERVGSRSGQLLGHIESSMAGRIAIDPGNDLPALLQIETGRLKMECRQHRACAAAAPGFFLGHRENPATESVAPQMLRQKKPLHGQQAERRAAQ